MWRSEINTPPLTLEKKKGSQADPAPVDRDFPFVKGPLQLLSGRLEIGNWTCLSMQPVLPASGLVSDER